MSLSKPREPQRIAKLLARAGIASRRDIERMIAEGRVAIGGVTIDTPATLITSLAGVTVDGNPVSAPAPARLFRFHKPTGVLTAARDPAGRPTLYDRLPAGLPRLMPVGRLDLNTEGLLLLTTDGELKRQLELPASGVERSYRARVYGEVSQARLEELMMGIEIEGVRYGSINANLERRTGANAWVELTLTEGKNREVRRVLEHLGLKVSRLIRTRYGPFHLGDLAETEVDEVRQHDLVAFRKALAGPGGGKAASSLTLGTRTRPAPARESSSPAAPPRNRAERRKAAAAEAPAPGRKPNRAARPADRTAAKPVAKERPRRAPRPTLPEVEADRPDGAAPARAKRYRPTDRRPRRPSRPPRKSE